MTDRVLVIAAHPDDEALGCGGTIARHVEDGTEVFVLFVADGETARVMAAQPNRNISALKASKVLGAKPPMFLDQRDQRLDAMPMLDITQMIERVLGDIYPTIVYTHHSGDLNLDHRIVHQAAMTALRPCSAIYCNEIYAFEVLSSTEWGGGFEPNHFVKIGNGFLDKKIAALRCYENEMRPYPHPRSYEVVEALSAMRGSQCGVPHAEAFMTLRSIRR